MIRVSSTSVSDHISFNLDMFYDELREIGVDYVGHGVINDKGEHTGYFSHKSWKDHYLENGYFHKDPVLEIYDQTPTKIINWSNVEKKTTNKEILSRRMQYTGVIHGVTAIAKFNNHLEFLNLGFTNLFDVNKYLLENYLILENYMRVFRHYYTCQRA